MAAAETVAGWMGVFYNPVGLLPAQLSEKVLHGWQLHPGNVMGSFHHPLSGLTDEGGATAVPGRDAASQDTLYSRFHICPTSFLCICRAGGPTMRVIHSYSHLMCRHLYHVAL